MKRFLIMAFVAIACTIGLNAQKRVVDDIYQTPVLVERHTKSVTKSDLDIRGDSVRFVYAQIVGTSNLFSTKVKIEVDYGQEIDFWALSSERRLKDASGKAIKFNSMVDALNYMGTLGWEFVQAYTVTRDNTNVYHFLLKKTI